MVTKAEAAARFGISEDDISEIRDVTRDPSYPTEAFHVIATTGTYIVHGSAPTTGIAREDNLEAATKADLKEIATALGVSTSGTKQALIDRIRAAQEDTNAAAGT